MENLPEVCALLQIHASLCLRAEFNITLKASDSLQKPNWNQCSCMTQRAKSNSLFLACSHLFFKMYSDDFPFINKLHDGLYLCHYDSVLAWLSSVLCVLYSGLCDGDDTVPMPGLVQVHTAWQPCTDSLLMTLKLCPWSLNILKSVVAYTEKPSAVAELQTTGANHSGRSPRAGSCWYQSNLSVFHRFIPYLIIQILKHFRLTFHLDSISGWHCNYFLLFSFIRVVLKDKTAWAEQKITFPLPRGYVFSCITPGEFGTKSYARQ